MQLSAEEARQAAEELLRKAKEKREVGLLHGCVPGSRAKRDGSITSVLWLRCLPAKGGGA